MGKKELSRLKKNSFAAKKEGNFLVYSKNLCNTLDISVIFI